MKLSLFDEVVRFKDPTCSFRSDNQQGQQQGQSRSQYVPPHLRNRSGGSRGGFGGSGYSNNGNNGNRRYNNFGGSGYNNNYGGGYQNRRGGFNGGFGGRGGGRGGFGRNFPRPGVGRWVDGKHEPSAKDEKLEVSLFGTADDSAFQSSGINFDNYDDIPVEASGDNVLNQSLLSLLLHWILC
ncbi:hypothetical protein QCA50_018619 [Cerrena zonata]|uniref:Uncharacterized protein n=1 Tax=Cerrena zonata TaxID=2478898 RepID=A0AAW0FCD5_9APHY